MKLKSNISIHSLQVEGDIDDKAMNTAQVISIHSLQVEGDITHFKTANVILLFQSTPSKWRETAPRAVFFHFPSISIHSLQVEGDQALLNGNLASYISIHSLQVEGDALVEIHRGNYVIFQSTPSKWRETW